MVLLLKFLHIYKKIFLTDFLYKLLNLSAYIIHNVPNAYIHQYYTINHVY